MNTKWVQYDDWSFVYLDSIWFAIDLESGELLTIDTWVTHYGAYCQ